MKSWDDIAKRVREVEQMSVDWENDVETPTVEYERRQVKAVTQKLDRSWSDLHDFVCGGEIAEEAYELVMLMDDWIEEVDKFRDDNNANPGGTKELWDSWAKVVGKAAQKPQPQMLEAISTLARIQKCSPMQIAKIYEWKDEFGQPDTNRVLGLIEANTDVPTISPHWHRYQEQVKAKWEARQNRMRQQKTDTPKPVTNYPLVAPESMELLLTQGVPSKQIARMKQVDQQTVIDYARELNLPVDGETLPPAMKPDERLSAAREADNDLLKEARRERREKQQAADKMEADGEIDTYSQLNNYKEQVRQMAFDGCTKQQIVSLLKEQHPNRCKPGSVAQIMAAMEREAAANQE